MSEGTGLKDDTAATGRRVIKGVQFKTKKIANIKNITGSDTVGVYYTDVDQGFLNLLNQYHVTLKSKKVNSD